ncbi:MAG TPA: carbonic anhydrase [Planctomycetota bacterium]|nr:carbonic anhydrase [Planctomycetota bacterium]
MNEIIETLLAGNRRAIETGKAAPQPAERRPVAAVLACTDERVVPQAIFDQPPGKLYMVRVAGNVMTSEIAGSLELGVDRLGCRLVVVLGHTDCTAVRMSRDTGWYEGSAFDIARRIRTSTHHLGSDAPLEDFVRSNVEGAIRDLREMSRILRDLESKGELTIVGAVYDITTGRVKLL